MPQTNNNSSSGTTLFAIFRSFAQAVVGSLVVAIIMALVVNYFYTRDTTRDMVNAGERIIVWQEKHDEEHLKFEHGPSRATSDVYQLKYRIGLCHAKTEENNKRLRAIELSMRGVLIRQGISGMDGMQ